MASPCFALSFMHAHTHMYIHTHSYIFRVVYLCSCVCISQIDISLQIPHEYASAVSATQAALPAALCKSLQLVQVWH